MTINTVFIINLFLEKVIFSWLKYLNRFVGDRSLFERNNLLTQIAFFDYWFHISSEGELEQIIPLLDHLRQSDKEILLIYTSPSVLKKVEFLKSKYLGLETMSYPIIDGRIFDKLPPPKYLFMVRYDFFPRLMKVAKRADVKAVLLSATIKNKKINLVNAFWWRAVYQSFNKIFWSTLPNNKILKKLGIESLDNIEYDFRHRQIIERQKMCLNLSSSKGYNHFLEKLELYSKEKRVILGSLWSSELSELLPSLIGLIDKGYFIYLAPHHLKGNEYNALLDCFAGHKISFCELSDLSDYNGESIVLSKVPGILCEIYPLFRHAFVGGGHGRSVHSLLEPYWANCFVYCGPKVHRSTEYDYIVKHNKDRVYICDNLVGLEDALLKCDTNSVGIKEETKKETIEMSNLYIKELCHLNTGHKL